MSALISLAADINREHEAAQECAGKAVEHAKRAGELLIEAKGTIPHGEWIPWLATNVQFSERTAQTYMRVTRELPKLEGEKAHRVADLSLRDAIRALSQTATNVGKAEKAGISLDAIAESTGAGSFNRVVARAVQMQKLANIAAENRPSLDPPDSTGRALLIEVHRESGRIRVKLGANQAYMTLRETIAALSPEFDEHRDEVTAKLREAEALEKRAKSLRDEAGKLSRAIDRVMANEIKVEAGPIYCAESLTYQIPPESIPELERDMSQPQIADALLSGELPATLTGRAFGLDVALWGYVDNAMTGDGASWVGVGLEAA